jgi:hypothetical protein
MKKTNFRKLITIKAKLLLLLLFMCLSADKAIIASDKMSAKFLDDILNDTEIPMDRTSPTHPKEDPFLEGIQFAQGILKKVNLAQSVGSQPRQKKNGLPFGCTPEDIFSKSYMEGLEVVQETNRRIQHIFDGNLRENPSLVSPDDTFTKGYLEGLEFVTGLAKQHTEFFEKCENDLEQTQDTAPEKQEEEIYLKESSEEAIAEEDEGYEIKPQHLAQTVGRSRDVYQKDGVYTTDVRESLQTVVEQNKQKFPDLFTKKANES